MEIGLTSFWQHAVPGVDDRRFVDEELRLAVLAEELGFDFVAMPEHHFEDYSMCVDNVAALAHVAAKTSRIKLMTAVIVLPWHDPVRVAERIILLDHISDGRVMFGVGRGLAPREYAAFGVDQNEARGRFDEMSLLLARALETGILQGDGPYYRYEPLELRPRPFKSFKDRLYSVANSPDSARSAARMGARLTLLVAKEFEKMLPTIELWQDTWRESHESEPPAPLVSDFTFCSRDPELLDRARTEWFPKTWEMTVDHYDLQQVDFTKITGYETHAEKQTRKEYADTQIWGAPEDIIEAYRKRIELMGSDLAATWVFRMGGMPYDVAEQSMRLFADEVLPELKRISAPASRAAA
jgi:alkanesulfonate monooxygenase SsuD/methylene tetrahydromethanopterin reductase-like flavin-dependent oxidoreductase (luciferase family)